MPAQAHILLVDDQAVNLMLLKRKLERAGMMVDSVSSGQACLDFLVHKQPDLILLDVSMPEMDGFEACEKIQSDPKCIEIPIIFITSKKSKEEKIQGLSAGAVDYITKPIDFDETLARVKTQIRLQTMFRENRNLQDRLGEARRSAAIGAVAQGLTHNLNNLLGVVVGYIDLMKCSYDKPSMIQRSVEHIDHSLGRIISVVRQLGTIANSEHEYKQSISVNSVIESSIERFNQESAALGEVRFETKVPNSVNILANQENFETALIKLLTNAGESYATVEDSSNCSIVVCAHQDASQNQPQLVITVSDQGSGIDPAMKERVFEPFVTNKSGVGRGMGLTIARHIMRKNDGDVQVTDSSESGTSIRIIYPIA
jgi:CheY-like chemotaxis protein/anti-sigma regulatory factor (Ser/Thr protein kinase)